LPVRRVDEIHWRVPAGHNGLTGFRISMRGVQVFPSNLGGWIVANGQQATWPVHDMPDSGDWSITAYNTGSVVHVIYVTYMASLILPASEPPLLAAFPFVAPVMDLSHAGRPLPGESWHS